MSLPFVSLDAATVAGAGASRDLEDVGSVFGVLMSHTGAPTSVTVVLEGSHDGVIWHRVADSPVLLSEGYPSTFVTVTDHLFRHVRAYLVTLSGGSSPTVTASIAAL